MKGVRMARPLRDCVMPGQPVRADVEKAYRRGFHQGAALALGALREGASVEELFLWVERLRTWRRRTADWTGERPVKPRQPPAAPPFPARQGSGVRAWRRALAGPFRAPRGPEAPRSLLELVRAAVPCIRGGEPAGGDDPPVHPGPDPGVSPRTPG
jgi:hypothetical protein